MNFNRNFIFGGLFFLLAFSFGRAQESVTFIFDDATVDQGQTVDVDVRVEDFNSILSFQFAIFWDQNVLELNRIKAVNSTIDLDTGRVTISDGNVLVSWDNSQNPSTIADNEVLFTLEFTAVGVQCATTAIELGDPPNPLTNIEIIAGTVGNAREINAEEVVGSVMINGAACSDNLIIRLSDYNVEEGTNICIPVEVENFAGIRTIDFQFRYDTTVLRYTGVGEVNLPGFGTSNINQNGNLIIISYNSSNPISVADGTLLEFCFDAVGAVASSSVLEVLNNSRLEIIGSDGSEITPQLSSGRATIVQGMNDDDMQFVLNNTEGAPGETVCMPVTVRNFDRILNFGLQLIYDQNALEFIRFENDGILSNLGSSNINNEIRFTWDDGTGEGITLSDGTEIIRVCFELLGDCEDETTISENVNFSARGVQDITGDIPFNVRTGTLTASCFTPELAVSSNITNVPCNGDCQGEIRLTISGGTSPYTIEWGDGSNERIRQDLCAGEYNYTVTDQAGETVSGMLSVSEPAVLEITSLETACSDSVDNNGQVVVQVSGGVAPYMYSYNGTDFVTENAQTGLEAGNYTLFVRDGNNCEVMGEYRIIECGSDEDCYDATPIITPNGDNMNDRFQITCATDANNTFRVYNRFGKLVYEEENYANNWDGVDQSGAVLDEGNYIWVLVVKPFGGEEEIHKGTVTVLTELR